MARRYVVKVEGPDGKVIVQATHGTHPEAISALAQALDGELGPVICSPAAARRLLTLWLTGGDVFEVLSKDYQTTCSITIINE
jgi:hypothetical protein